MGLFDIFKPRKQIDHYIFNVIDDDFERQVLQRSFKYPVLADFWADWCAPCRQLGPVLERIALSADAPFRLAKVRTDDAPDFSAKYRIQSIPAVKLFRNGAVIGQFQGLQLEHNIRRFADKAIAKPVPVVRIRGAADPAERVAQAVAAIRAGDGFRATLLLQKLGDDPAATQLRPLAQFMWDATDGDILSGNRKLDELYLDAADAIEDGQLNTAQHHLTAAHQKTKEAEQDRLTAVLSAFDLMM